MVGAAGLELATPCSQSRCATNCAMPRNTSIVYYILRFSSSVFLFFFTERKRDLYFLVTDVFCLHFPKVNAADDPGHIIVNRNRDCPHAFGDETGKAFGRMVLPVPLLSHFRRVLFIDKDRAEGKSHLFKDSVCPLLDFLMMRPVSHDEGGNGVT